MVTGSIKSCSATFVHVFYDYLGVKYQVSIDRGKNCIYGERSLFKVLRVDKSSQVFCIDQRTSQL